VIARLDSIVGDILLKMYSEHVHRVWIVDDETRPRGLVTLTDLLNVLR
jgi:CBS domain-containing protein